MLSNRKIDNKYSIDFVIDNLDSMVSNNDMYFYMPMKSKRRPGSMTTHAIRTPALKNFQNVMSEKLRELIPDSFLKLCYDVVSKGYYGLGIRSYYYMPKSNYNISDVSNYIKAYEDCIVSRTKQSKGFIIDDKKHLEYYSKKICNLGDKWKVQTFIELVEKDPYYRSSMPIYCHVCDRLTDSHISEDLNSIICNECDNEKMVVLGEDPFKHTMSMPIKEFTCNTCGSHLLSEDGSSIMTCPNCNIDFKEI